MLISTDLPFFLHLHPLQYLQLPAFRLHHCTSRFSIHSCQDSAATADGNYYQVYHLSCVNHMVKLSGVLSALPFVTPRYPFCSKPFTTASSRRIVSQWLILLLLFQDRSLLYHWHYVFPEAMIV